MTLASRRFAELWAHAFASPLRHPAAFETAWMPAGPDWKSTLEIRDSVSTSLAELYPELPRDQVQGILRNAWDTTGWPGTHTDWFSLAGTVIQGLADREGRVWRATPEPRTPRPAGAVSWRWLCSVAPAHIWSALADASAGYSTAADRATAVTAVEARQFEDGLAEVHLHYGAGAPFAWLWVNAVNETRRSRRPSRAKTVNGRTARVLLGSMLRLLLADLVARPQVRGAGIPRVFLEAEQLAMESKLPEEGSYRAANWRYSLQELHRRFYPGSHRSTCAADVGARDTARHILGVAPPKESNGLWSVEPELIRRALVAARDSSRVRKLLWQYLRLQTLTFAGLTQHGSERGLSAFLNFFRELKPLREGAKSAVLEAAMLHSAGDGQLVSFEGRTSPEECRSELRGLIRKVAAVHDRKRDLVDEAALVLHFQKDGPKSGDKRRPLFARQWRRAERLARVLREVIENEPELLLVLRGLDWCSSELSLPTWVLLPHLKSVRAASVGAASRCVSDEGDILPLRVTVHAGEDYRHLAQGIRRVHEPIVFQLLKTGDRIGHGLALGHSPAAWAERNPVVTLRAAERLDDLIWERWLYRHAGVAVPDSRLLTLEVEAERLAQRIYAEATVSLNALETAWLERHNAHVLESLGFPIGPAPSAPVGEWTRLLHRLLFDARTRRRANHSLAVPTGTREVEALEAVQAHVRREVARLQITVEANPTSNTMIASISTKDHPAFRLMPVDATFDETTVEIAIGSDDPSTFASSLPEEYALLARSMRDDGVPDFRVRAWIERARKNGLRARFSVPRAPAT